MPDRQREKPDGLVALARETTDALGRLTLQHLRLARLEMRADLRSMGLQAALIAVLAAMAIVGYALTMAGIATLLGGYAKAGAPLLIIGVAHVIAAGAGIVIALARLRRMRPMNATAEEVGRSLAPLGLSATPTAPSPARKGGEERA